MCPNGNPRLRTHAKVPLCASPHDLASSIASSVAFPVASTVASALASSTLASSSKRSSCPLCSGVTDETRHELLEADDRRLIDEPHLMQDER